MKKIFPIIPFLALILSSCLKDKPDTDFSQIFPVVELTTASTNTTVQSPVSGLAFWSAAAVNWSAGALTDTVTFTANIASDYPLTTATAITLAGDSSLISTFNATGDAPVTYQYMPASLYTFAVTSGTIPAGARLDTFTIVFNASLFTDSAASYMLPIQIMTASNNLVISGNLSTIYFHVQGNPLQGVYTVTGTHYTYPDSIGWAGPTAGIPAGYTSAISLASFGPKNAVEAGLTAVNIDFADLAGSGYQYNITEGTDTLSVGYNFGGKVGNLTPYLVTYTPDPTYPSTKAVFHLMTYYTDASNLTNIVDETFTQQ
jgi:hypothetical protein